MKWAVKLASKSAVRQQSISVSSKGSFSRLATVS